MFPFVSLRNSVSAVRRNCAHPMLRPGILKPATNWRSGADLSFLPQGHQNNRGEEDAERGETGVDLAKRHTCQGCCCGCGADQKGHAANPGYWLRVADLVKTDGELVYSC